MKNINKKFLTALAALMIFAIVSVFVLMLWPLYGGIFTTDTDEERHFYMTIDGEEADYIKFETLSQDSFVIPFIKGEKLDAVDKHGIYNAYRWKIAPDSNTEYLLFEFIEKDNDNSMSKDDYRSKIFYIGKRVETNEKDQ